MVDIKKLGGPNGLILGDIFSLYWIVDNIPAGLTVTKAWLMVKTGYAVADGSATITKTITTANVAGTGQVEDDGANTQSARLRFDFTNANTTAVTAETVYKYSVQLKLSNSDVREFETGDAIWRSQVITASS